MKPLHYIILLLFTQVSLAQTALQHYGNMQVHNGSPNTGLGLHTNFINNDPLNLNQGLVGFYGNSSIQVSGTHVPNLWNTELNTTSDFYLNIPLYVKNDVFFFEGDVNSPVNNQNVHINVLDTGIFTGENDDSKVTGFAAATNRSVFTFPVGDRHQLRPLTMEAQGNAPLALCAYFFEDPSSPTSLPESFDIDLKVQNIGTVSNREFWVFHSDVPTRVNLPWNSRSSLGLIPNATAESIIVVGWRKSSNRWVVLGNTAYGGDLDNGFVTSGEFLPSEYAAITFGTVPLPTDTFAVNNPSLGNYFLSPNGDGVNDVLVIDHLEESPNNKIFIFNRFGQKVFEQTNYTNEFQGTSNTGSLYMSQDIGLPEGVYYYLVDLYDLNLQYTGFLFLDR